MATLLNIKYRGEEIEVHLSTTIGENRVMYLCRIPDKEAFEIELNRDASWVIVGKSVISADLVELIGEAYVNSIL